jgi:hypothetical protein
MIALMEIEMVIKRLSEPLSIILGSRMELDHEFIEHRVGDKHLAFLSW